VQPLLSGFDITRLTEQPVWRYFTTGLFIVPIALGFVIYALVKERSSEKTFLVIWCLIMLAAMLGQRRFAYYFAVNVALLSGYFCWITLEWGHSIIALPQRGKRKRKVAKRKKPARSIGDYLNGRYVWVAVVAIMVFFAAYYPSIGVAMDLAAQPSGPNEAWHSALTWMRENTPDPFEDPDSYYELYERPPSGEGYDYPESAYGVMSWWDYGHWITRIAHRIPNANPFQRGIGGTRPDGTIVPGASIFLTAQDEASANEVLDELGSKYVIIDIEMAMPLWKFHVMPTWAGKDQDEFYDVYYASTPEGELEPILLYHPGYYQSMCSRLYNFGAEAVVPANSTWVISYTERMDEGGNKYKVITDYANEGYPFATYEEAEAFVDDHPGYIIVGTTPLVSAVPLEELEHYELVHQTEQVSLPWIDRAFPYVRIFEYSP